jgi:hypothetical protein
MATDAQIKANRANAQRSTGPKSDIGKKVAAANSAKRGGISGNGKALSPDLWNKVATNKVLIAQGNNPADDYDWLLIEDAAIARVLMLECDDQLIALREHQAGLAKINWQDLRELEAGELAQQLARHPHATVRKLRQTPQGCAYLIDLWRVAEVDLVKQGTLTDATRDQILNLLGVTAAVRLAGLTELDAPGSDPAEVARAIVARELARLRTLADSPELKAACDKARERTIEGTEPPLSKDARLVSRYRNQHARKYQWCLNELKRRRNERERRDRKIAGLQEQLQRAEMAAIRRAHQDKTMPADLKAELPEVPPSTAKPVKPSAQSSAPAWTTGWTRESLEEKLKRPMSKRNRAHYEQMLANLIEQERLASAAGPR